MATAKPAVERRARSLVPRFQNRPGISLNNKGHEKALAFLYKKARLKFD